MKLQVKAVYCVYYETTSSGGLLCIQYQVLLSKKGSSLENINVVAVRPCTSSTPSRQLMESLVAC